jgi:hypothetical protein
MFVQWKPMQAARHGRLECLVNEKVKPFLLQFPSWPMAGNEEVLQKQRYAEIEFLTNFEVVASGDPTQSDVPSSEPAVKDR